MSLTAEERRAESKMRVHMDIDRRLWLRFKGRVNARGKTLTGRIVELVQLDLRNRVPDSKPEPAATP